MANGQWHETSKAILLEMVTCASGAELGEWDVITWQHALDPKLWYSMLPICVAFNDLRYCGLMVLFGFQNDIQGKNVPFWYKDYLSTRGEPDCKRNKPIPLAYNYWPHSDFI